MGKVRRTHSAQQDLFDIWSYIAEDSQDAADAEMNELSSLFDDLSSFPRMGRKRPDLGKNIRSVAHGNYLVAYRTDRGGILIVRVLRGGRDVGTAFPRRKR